MQIKQCRFLLNTLNQTLQKNNIKVQPKIKSELMLNGAFADSDPYTAKITLNKILNCKLLKFLTKKYIKHEVKHIEQAQIMARYFAGISGNIDKGLEQFRKLLIERFPLSEIEKFNEKFYKKTIEIDGVINKKHHLFKKAKAYVEAFKEYPDMSLLDDIDVWYNKGFSSMIRNRKRKMKLYKNNILEKEARIASKQN